MNNKFRFWDETGFNFVFSVNTTSEEVADAIQYVEENVENYDNNSVIERLEEKGFKVTVIDDIPEENEFFWG